MAYETVIGLEVHLQLTTESKAFCADATRFGAFPNTQVSAVSLAHPGTLPRLNRQAVAYAVKLGHALGCNINPASTFDRKNYFYADLPKGFQTTQDRSPICIGGALNGVRIHHIHLEEDAGKSIHDQHPTESLIDLNRAGVPLLELVTEPDLRSAEEVVRFMQAMRRLARWLGISDGNMEEGSLRCDLNVSVRKTGADAYGQRCEIKNVNSMRFARKAIEYEVKRQIDVLEAGEAVRQETRGFDAQSGRTYSLRSKENAHDYRYFPEPDLPPVMLSATWIEHLKQALPELPEALRQRLEKEFGLSAYDAEQLTQDKSVADYYFELIAGAERQKERCKALANLLINKILPWCSEQDCELASSPVSPEQWNAYAALIETGKISASQANQKLFPLLMENPQRAPLELAEENQLLQTEEGDALEEIVRQVLAMYPEKVREYQNGKKGLIGMFMGEVMKAAKGKADPQATNKILQELLRS